MKSRYSFRLRPGAVAERALWQEEGRNRWVWNQAIEARNAGRLRLDSKALTSARKEHDWLRAGSSIAQQQTLRDFYTGKGRRKPRTKRDARPTLNYTRSGFTLKRTPDGPIQLVVAGGITLPVVWSRELPSTPSRCTSPGGCERVR